MIDDREKRTTGGSGEGRTGRSDSGQPKDDPGGFRKEYEPKESEYERGAKGTERENMGRSADEDYEGAEETFDEDEDDE